MNLIQDPIHSLETERLKIKPYRSQKTRQFITRQAFPSDVVDIIDLYQLIYEGRYSLPFVRDLSKARELLQRKNYKWYVAENISGNIIGSVLFSRDPELRIGKSFGAAVHPDYRGKHITEILMKNGINDNEHHDHFAWSTYATTRSVGDASQRITEKLGFKKCGIFPNVRRVNNYETHGLVVHYHPDAMQHRQRIHQLPDFIRPLYEIVSNEVKLPDKIEFKKTSLNFVSPYEPLIELEPIVAQNFIKHCYRNYALQQLTEGAKANNTFYPFHAPNLMLVGMDNQVKLFLYHSETDQHSVLIGGEFGTADYAHVLNSMALLMDRLGARYIEILVNARDFHCVKETFEARYLPCAYYPAMRWNGKSLEDYIVFSRTLTVLDFKNISLIGTFNDYLNAYFELWKTLYVER